MLVGPQSRSGRCEVEENVLPLLGTAARRFRERLQLEVRRKSHCSESERHWRREHRQRSLWQLNMCTSHSVYYLFKAMVRIKFTTSRSHEQRVVF
jgi:hypothetical protein